MGVLENGMPYLTQRGLATVTGGARPSIGSGQSRPMSTPKTPAERQAAFKTARRASGMVRIDVYVSAAQRAKFGLLGGSEWLRKRIDRARV